MHLDVVVDGIIYQVRARGGIGRLYSEVLPRMCDQDDSLLITLVAPQPWLSLAPDHRQIERLAIPRLVPMLRARLGGEPILSRFRERAVGLLLQRRRDAIWHSTYFTSQEGWRGPRVVTVVDMIYERFPELFNAPWDERFRQHKRRCILSADKVICISNATRCDVESFYGLDRHNVAVIHLGTSDVFRRLDATDAASSAPPGQPFLLYVGGRDHYKNFDALLVAYGVWRPRADIALVVLGRPWSPSEKARLLELGIEDRVILVPNADDESLCHLYNRAVALVHPSLHEGFGIPILEAFACGCPVVASRIPSTLEIAGDTAIYFDPHSVSSLACALDQAVQEAPNSGRIQKGLDLARQHSWDDTARKMLGIYRQLAR